MLFIHHRRNSIEELRNTSSLFGIEIDIRSHNSRLILSHDPFENGEYFEDWLKFFKHKTLIINIKEEGLEKEICKILKNFKINDYFFLDQSFPFLIKYHKLLESKCAVRFSEYESIQTVLKLKNIVNWVWVDFFNKFPLTKSYFELLKENNFKICIVSPELQGYQAKKEIKKLKVFLLKNDIKIDAICTKVPDLWIM